MKTVLLIPIWFIQLFTPAKSFKSNPIIGSVTLNKWGLHKWRVWTANKVMRFRMWLLSYGVDRNDQQQYQQQGFIIKENYLDETVFQKLEQEVRNFQSDDVRECNQGDTQNHRILLDPKTVKGLPQVKQLMASKPFRRLMRYTAGYACMPVMHIEQVRNGFRKSNAVDPQKNLHTDTFHPTMKFWLFIDDVDEVNGPFTYVPTSNQLTSQRLEWEYLESHKGAAHENSYSARGSFRFSKADREFLGLPPPKKLRVKRNTLVIANTFGIHGRGNAEQGSTRLAIWGMSRTNPFVLFPGLGFEFINRLQYYLLNRQRKRADRKAAARGGVSSWHKVDH